MILAGAARQASPAEHLNFFPRDLDVDLLTEAATRAARAQDRRR